MTKIDGYEPSEQERASLPKVGADDVTLIYACDYYDGPLSGMLEWKGSWYWFECFDQGGTEEKGVRYFGLWQLSPESNEWEAERNSKFCELVGEHWNYATPNQKKFDPISHPNWQSYYELYPPNAKASLTGKLVGWAKW